MEDIFACCKTGDLATVQRLLENGTTAVDVQNKSLETPLFVASSSGKLDVVELLTQKSSDIDKSNEDGWSPLFIAAANGHGLVVSHLLKNKASVNIQSTRGITPLWMSRSRSHKDVEKILLENGADTNQTVKVCLPLPTKKKRVKNSFFEKKRISKHWGNHSLHFHPLLSFSFLTRHSSSV